MSKFVVNTVEVEGTVSITVEEFNAELKKQGGLKAAISSFVDKAFGEFADEDVIYVVDANEEMARNIAAVLNTNYAQEVELMEANGVKVGEAMKPSFKFAGGEVVAMENTQEQAINNIINGTKKPAVNQTKETKGADVKMENKTIKELVAQGVNDSDALSIAEQYMKKNSAAMKDAQKPVKQEVKEEVKMNGRKAGGVVTEEGNIPRFGGSQQQANSNNNTNQGGKEMNNTTAENKGNGGRKGGGNQSQGNTGGYIPSYTFGGNLPQAADAQVEGRSGGYDTSVRQDDYTVFPGPWYLNADLYPILGDFMFFYGNRKNIPTNEYGITAINFLNPRDKKVINYDNNYSEVVEVVFGQGINLRMRLTRFTPQEKAELEARGLKASKSDWKTGNIEWVKDKKNGLAPRYAFATPNDFVIAIKCECGKTHNARAKWKTTCEKCGKKHEPIEVAPTAKGAQGVTFVEGKYQPDWNKVVLDNFNIVVDKNVLAIALACIQYERFLPMHGVVEEESAE